VGVVVVLESYLGDMESGGPIVVVAKEGTMAGDAKAKDPGGSKEGPGSRAEADATRGTGVTTSGVRRVAGGGAAGGGTATAQLLFLYHGIEDELRGHLLGLGVQSKDLEDVLQRMLLAVLRRVKTSGLPEDPSGYMFTAAGNTAMRFLKDQRRHPLVVGVVGDAGDHEIVAPSSRRGLFQKMLRAERMERLEEGLAKVPPADAEIIRMVHFEELTQDQIAGWLGISVDAVEKRYARAGEAPEGGTLPVYEGRHGRGCRMNDQNPSSRSKEAWPPPQCPHLQELFDAAHEVIHPPPEERDRMRRDLVALLAAEERRIDADMQKKKAQKRTAFRVAGAALLLAAVLSAVAVATVVTVHAPRGTGTPGDAAASHVELPPPAEPAGSATSAGRQAPRRNHPR
jgi:RNA polymerase sigma factor (sigma-70 family)